MKCASQALKSSKASNSTLLGIEYNTISQEQIYGHNDDYRSNLYTCTYSKTCHAVASLNGVRTTSETPRLQYELTIVIHN